MLDRNLLRFTYAGKLVLDPDITLQARDFAALLQHSYQHGKHADHRTSSKKQQQHYYERRLPLVAKKIIQRDRLVILDRKSEQRDEQQSTQQPIEITHGIYPKKTAVTIA